MATQERGINEFLMLANAVIHGGIRADCTKSLEDQNIACMCEALYRCGCLRAYGARQTNKNKQGVYLAGNIDIESYIRHSTSERPGFITVYAELPHSNYLDSVFFPDWRDTVELAGVSGALVINGEQMAGPFSVAYLTRKYIDGNSQEFKMNLKANEDVLNVDVRDAVAELGQWIANLFLWTVRLAFVDGKPIAIFDKDDSGAPTLSDIALLRQAWFSLASISSGQVSVCKSCGRLLDNSSSHKNERLYCPPAEFRSRSACKSRWGRAEARCLQAGVTDPDELSRQTRSTEYNKYLKWRANTFPVSMVTGFDSDYTPTGLF